MSPETLRSWIESAGGRRFLLTVGAGIVDTLLLVFGFLSEASYVQLTLGTVAVFIAGTSWQKKGQPQ